MSKLSPQQRAAFMAGYRRARRRAQRQMADLVDELGGELENLRRDLADIAAEREALHAAVQERAEDVDMLLH